MLDRILEQHHLLNGQQALLEVLSCMLEIFWKSILTHVLMITVNLGRNRIERWVTLRRSPPLCCSERSASRPITSWENTSQKVRTTCALPSHHYNGIDWKSLEECIWKIYLSFTECTPKKFHLKECAGGHFIKLRGGGHRMCVFVSNVTLNFTDAEVSLGTQRCPTLALITGGLRGLNPLTWPWKVSFHLGF